MPVAGWYAIVSNALGVDSISKLEDIQDVAVMAATGAWRLGKDTYQIDPDVYDAVVSTRIDDAIPHDIFFRLPAWGIYVQMKNAEIEGFLLISNVMQTQGKSNYACCFCTRTKKSVLCRCISVTTRRYSTVLTR